MSKMDPRLATTRTTCPYCGVGCGVLATPDGRGGVAIAGDPAHPANFGRLCSKGSALGETIGLETRLLYPMLRADDGSFIRTDWNAALDRVADAIAETMRRHGSDAVALYLSGQLLTEDYYVANKLMKGFIGSANVDTNSRLCMASAVAGQKRAFGADTVPICYEDLDDADLIVLVGSNAAWCHPILFQRIQANKAKRGARVVVIDPRRTATAEGCDLFLPITPGEDTTLFSGLLVNLAECGALDSSYIAAHTQGFDEAVARAHRIAPDIDTTARRCGLVPQDVAAFFDMFAKTPRVVTCYSQGVNQSAQGTDKVNAIINCHLATGRIGRPGAGPFSLTGQPNAMGGREVGGLANQLAAHMGFSADEIARVRRFWNAPRMVTGEGLKAVDLFNAIARGKIRTLWVMGTNPAVSMPDADSARRAMRQLDCLIVSDNVLATDTINSGAHVVLPALAWGEKSGTVTNSERRISRQRSFLPAPGEARPDWWIVSEAAKRLGFGDSFSYRSAADIFREHSSLSAFENDGSRDFNIGALAEIDDAAYRSLEPFQWPACEGKHDDVRRMFADGHFFTPDRRARFIATETPTLASEISDTYPFRLNTGRVRDHWHTMTRTGLSPRLAQHILEPFAEIHPSDAATLGARQGDFVRLSNAYGECVLKVIIDEGQKGGSVFAPIHWSNETASNARTSALVAPITDPYSGQPETKSTPVALTPARFIATGFILTRARLALPPETWWARVTLAGPIGYRIASNDAAFVWRDWIAGEGDQIAEYHDETAGILRLAAYRQDRVTACVFLARDGDVPDWTTAATLFAHEQLTPDERRGLLSGLGPDGTASEGVLVCACFGVGRASIDGAIAKGARSVDAIGTNTKAGTNCGSCVPELKRLLAANAELAIGTSVEL